MTRRIYFPGVLICCVLGIWLFSCQISQISLTMIWFFYINKSVKYPREMNMFNRNCKHYFDLLEVDLVSCIFSSTCFFSIISLHCHVFDFPLWKKNKNISLWNWQIIRFCFSVHYTDTMSQHSCELNIGIWRFVATLSQLSFQKKILWILHYCIVLELAVCYIRKMHDAQTNLCPVFLYLWQFYNCTIIFQIDKMHLRRQRRSIRTNKHQFLPSSCRGFELHVISSSSACAVLWMTSCAIVFYVE